jgi:acid phosphatase
MKKIFAILFVVQLFTACQTRQLAPDTSSKTLYSTLWIQHAAEYEALTYQAYNAADRFLPVALADSSWTASLEQGDNYRHLPPAIILDLDETAIDNSFYEARVILDKTSFDPGTWNNWVREKQADAIKGAVELTQKADEMGIAVYYITNRDAITEQETIDNLIALGFPVADGSVMSNGARPDWTSSKIVRRNLVASDHRILMIFGDDLNDFLPARTIPMEERKRLVTQHSDKWSVKWFILPNPNYGSWERALYTGDEVTDEDRQNRRLELLKDKRSN